MAATSPLSGRVAVVTGGGRGIGRAIALAFARAGAGVCVVARTSAQIDTVAGEICDLGRRSLAVTADVTDRAHVETMAGQVRDTLGRLDLLVNNAGGGSERRPIIDSDPDRWVRDIHVNLVSAYLVTRALLPLMVESGGGKVINIGSGMGHSPNPGAYSVAKAGMWMFTRQLANEVWDKGIEVNELVPGPVLTDATRDRFTVGGAPPFSPSERVKTPEEVAPLALWLATQQPGGPTGQSFSLARRPLQ